jgi:5'-3' exonuclease
MRKLLNEDLYHKVFVFWDGKFSGKLRYEIYKPYKSSRGKDYENGTHPVEISELEQRKKIWDYLNALNIRQITDEVVESDDFIGYYCLNRKEHEFITICTTDRDMCQLVSDNVKIYFCDLKTYVSVENYSTFFQHHYENAALIKIITGDNSDTIKGIKGVKETTLLSLFPTIKEKRVSLQELIEQAKILQEQRVENKQKPLKTLENIINAITDGVQGEKIYEINTALVDLKNPLITEDAIQSLDDLIDGEFNMNDRGLKNVIQKMKIDGLEKTIGPNRYSEYLIPFKQLIEREIKQSF